MKSALKVIKEHPTFVIFVVLAGWMLLTLSDFRPVALVTGSWKTTSSPTFGFSVTHPGTWRSRQYAGGYPRDERVIFLIRNEFDDDFYGIEISQQPATDPTLEEVAEWGEELRKTKGGRLYESLPGFEASELQRSIIDGIPILRRIYRADRGDAMDEDVYIARHNDMIIITLRTTQSQYNNYIDEFNSIVASFTPKE